ncbi:polyprenyl synthetase family protein [candidate division WOR-3 bacterium]|nr:polyprenyl synthetase family protein [candidate division WOR-3 bacterium]
MISVENRLKENRGLVEKWLNENLPQKSDFPEIIHEAVRYSVLGAGKYLRSYLVLEACRVSGGKEINALPVAGAIEMLHSYSLIHDDLPAMDDDDLRRGKPTSHKKFGEDIAVLAGDALCTYAWQVIADSTPPEVCSEVVKVLGKAVGTKGMIGGQVADMHWHRMTFKKQKMLRYIHRHKTAALISASLTCGSVCAGADKVLTGKFERAGILLGMEFQIVDDILDETGDEKKMGKKLKKDSSSNKLTYPNFYGLKTSRFLAENYAKRAEKIFSKMGEKTSDLIELTHFILERSN